MVWGSERFLILDQTDDLGGHPCGLLSGRGDMALHRMGLNSGHACFKKQEPHHSVMRFCLSGRGALNSGPHGPEPCALAGLRYAPNCA